MQHIHLHFMEACSCFVKVGQHSELGEPWICKLFLLDGIFLSYSMWLTWFILSSKSNFIDFDRVNQWKTSSSEEIVHGEVSGISAVTVSINRQKGWECMLLGRGEMHIICREHHTFWIHICSTAIFIWYDKKLQLVCHFICHWIVVTCLEHREQMLLVAVRNLEFRMLPD